jgi:hypothetical protein
MKRDTKFRQKQKVGVAGSFINQMMGNNDILPEVGKGATELHYTDRTCYEVIEVSDDYKTVKLEALDAKVDPAFVGKTDVGHQNWILEPTGRFLTVVWNRGAWRAKSSRTVFTNEFIAEAEKKGIFACARALTPEQHKEIYGDDILPQKVVPGITREKTTYTKLNLIFGRKDYYYDWSF